MLRRLIEGLLVQLAAVAGTIAVLLWGVLLSSYGKTTQLYAPDLKTFAWISAATWLIAFAASQYMRFRAAETP